MLALSIVLLHTLTNGQYGFHRDELATLDDARYLDWGYVVYPPLTPFIARLSLAIFGPSLIALRFFAALALAIASVLSGLMARELGGKRWAQLIAGSATAVAPVAFGSGTLFQYVSFDYLWWVLTAYFLIRLLHSEDPRRDLGIDRSGSGPHAKEGWRAPRCRFPDELKPSYWSRKCNRSRTAAAYTAFPTNRAPILLNRVGTFSPIESTQVTSTLATPVLNPNVRIMVLGGMYESENRNERS